MRTRLSLLALGLAVLLFGFPIESLAQAAGSVPAVDVRRNLSLRAAMTVAVSRHPDVLLAELGIANARIQAESQAFGRSRSSELVDLLEEVTIMRALFQRRSAIDGIQQSVMQLYYAVKVAQKSLAMARQDLEYARRALGFRQAQFDNGLVDRIALQRAREQVESKQQAYQAAVQNHRISIVQFLLAIDYPLSMAETIRLSDDVTRLSDAISIESDLSDLGAINPQIQLLTLEAEYQAANLEAVENSTLSDDAKEQARYASQQASLELYRAERQVRTQVMSSYLDILTKNRSVDAAYSSLQTARENLADSREKLERGIISEEELFGADLAALGAEVQYLNAISEYNVAVLGYRQLMQPFQDDEMSLIRGQGGTPSGSRRDSVTAVLP